MKYANNVDYLTSSIIYLGTHSFYWARSSNALSKELSLDQAKLQEVFDGFPGLFRKSHRLSESGQHYYALQARYAQREGEDTDDPEQVSYIEPLDTETVKMLLDFVLKMTEQEKSDQRSVWTNRLSIITAIFSAITTIIVATGLLAMKPGQKTPVATRPSIP